MPRIGSWTCWNDTGIELTNRMLTRQQLGEYLSGQARHVHFVGIGGSGMSALARLLAQQGHSVSGCDLHPNGETETLTRLGVKIVKGHAARHLRPNTDLVVHTSAVNGENEELRAAAERNIPVVRRGAVLSALMNHRHNIAVVGTHGKTTTSAMIAHVLSRSDSAPSFCIGAPVPCLGASSQLGAGKYFVAETDESDGTLIDFTPDYAVCLNIEPEHLDHYGTVENLHAAFATLFASTLRTVFWCADCPGCARLTGNLRSAISFGLSLAADYRALEIEPTATGQRFRVACRDQEIGTVELVVPGRHNVVNALAAIAVADQLGMPFDKIAAALAGYTGARRRFERKFEGDGILVVEDYAHHPTEIRATIAAARSLLGSAPGAGYRRVVVAFQPHRYTRVQALREQFATAFSGADKLFLTEIYAAGEKPIEGVNGRALWQAVRAAGHADAAFEADAGKLTDRLFCEARPGDLILVMGAGDIGSVSQALAKKLFARGPNLVLPSRQPQEIESDLRRLCSDETRIAREESMARHTTMRVGGPAQFWIEPANERDLARLLRYSHERQIPLTVVGRGSNLLVSDDGLPGMVVRLRAPVFSQVVVDGEQIIVGSGASLRRVVNLAREYELSGLEFLEGIPGSVGGALRMNAGSMGRQTFDVTEWVRYISLTGEIYDAEARTLPVRYRNCPVFANHVVLSAILRGQKAPVAAIDVQLRAFAKHRRLTQPAVPSAGCVFKNPAGMPAGKLIEELGFKGTKEGGAKISDVHANFIVNEGGATATDVLRLIARVRERALAEREIELETEVMILGKEERRNGVME